MELGGKVALVTGQQANRRRGRDDARAATVPTWRSSIARRARRPRPPRPRFEAARSPRAAAAGGSARRRGVHARRRRHRRRVRPLDVLVNLASVYIATAIRRPDARRLERRDGGRSARVLVVRARGRSAHAPGRRRPHRQLLGLDRAQSAVHGIARFLPYYVAKGAVVALTEALALELAADSILVNAVAPGPIAPPPRAPQQATLCRRRARDAARPVGRRGTRLRRPCWR